MYRPSVSGIGQARWVDGGLERRARDEPMPERQTRVEQLQPDLVGL